MMTVFLPDVNVLIALIDRARLLVKTRHAGAVRGDCF